ncbi:unnamed protein product [Fructobacillus fructosus]|uniref:Uncharacterized protein n=1 Tax=Fructobacillus fructosus TaxID=1631 RepID=A0ABM9MN82_9LACO|nr:unnamed protein product [Fructobacillus fructosus]CAK1227834.1 unnamed protein product [Fructobacillus fructosus]
MTTKNDKQTKYNYTTLGIGVLALIVAVIALFI